VYGINEMSINNERDTSMMTPMQYRGVLKTEQVLTGLAIIGTRQRRAIIRTNFRSSGYS
jgi:hypothetical protein